MKKVKNIMAVLLAVTVLSVGTTEINAAEITYTEEDVEVLALMAMGESEDQSEEGQRLVIDSALNRVDSNYFPDNIYEVVYQKNQYAAMWNGRLDYVVVTEEMKQLVREELENRYNSDVIYFRTNRYSKYGTPLFKVGDHYFSSY